MTEQKKPFAEIEAEIIAILRELSPEDQLRAVKEIAEAFGIDIEGLDS
jgi:hypothetical protein